MDHYHNLWNNGLKDFWQYRLRELATHIIVFAVLNLIILNGNFSNLSTPSITFVELFTFLPEAFDDIPWLTIIWGVMLLLHIGFVVTAAGWSRFFRYKIAREYDQQAANITQQPPATASKEKRQSPQAKPDYVRLQDYHEAYEKAEQR